MVQSSPHIIAINGIRTPAVSDSWPKHFLPYVESRYQCSADAYYYRTGAIPPWNLWVANPHVARVLASTIVARMKEARCDSLHIVGHSNGTNIAVNLAQRLRRLGVGVDTLILIASALHSDIGTSGLSELIAGGWVRRAVAYCSPEDSVIAPLQRFPGFYGSLGTKGFERKGQTTGLRVSGDQVLGREWGEDKHRYVTRWFSGFAHGAWFNSENLEKTFHCISQDLGLIPNTACRCPGD